MTDISKGETITYKEHEWRVKQVFGGCLTLVQTGAPQMPGRPIMLTVLEETIRREQKVEMK